MYILTKFMVSVIHRLKREYQLLQQSPPTGVTLKLPSDSDLYTWEATIDGPEESVYKGTVQGLSQIVYGIIIVAASAAESLEPVTVHV